MELCHRLADTRLGFDAGDLEGGMQLARGPAGVDAQTARPSAFIAAAIGHPDLLPDRDAAWRGHLLSMRYLRQLILDDAMVWAVAGPTRARGGIRAAAWRGRCPWCWA